MRGRGGMVWLVSGTLGVAALGSEPSNAPLADSQKALDSLRKEQSQKAAPTSGKLRDLLPTIEAPGAPAGPTEYSGPPKTEKLPTNKERKENWLLNGMDKLDVSKKPASGSPRRDRLKATDADEPAAATDLLGLYSAQQKQSRADHAPQTKPAASDPLAPFLQNWLHGSPVRGQFFDETLRRSEAGGSADRALPATQTGSQGAAVGRLADLPGFRDAAQPTQASAGKSPSNPYLRVMDTPAPETRSGRLPAALPAAPLTPTISPLPPPAPVERKAPATPPTEDKKYFPQLKKF